MRDGKAGDKDSDNFGKNANSTSSRLRENRREAKTGPQALKRGRVFNDFRARVELVLFPSGGNFAFFRKLPECRKGRYCPARMGEMTSGLALRFLLSPLSCW